MDHKEDLIPPDKDVTHANRKRLQHQSRVSALRELLRGLVGQPQVESS